MFDNGTELEVVRGFLTRRIEIDPARIVPTAVLKDLDVDSLMLLELFFEFEDKLNFKLPQDLPTPTTVGQLIDIVKELRHTAAAA